MNFSQQFLAYLFISLNSTQNNLVHLSHHSLIIVSNLRRFYVTLHNKHNEIHIKVRIN